MRRGWVLPEIGARGVNPPPPDPRRGEGEEEEQGGFGAAPRIVELHEVAQPSDPSRGKQEVVVPLPGRPGSDPAIIQHARDHVVLIAQVVRLERTPVGEGPGLSRDPLVQTLDSGVGEPEEDEVPVLVGPGGESLDPELTPEGDPGSRSLPPMRR
jgi:hypothetical protein